jgi:hypothetical protein
VTGGAECGAGGEGAGRGGTLNAVGESGASSASSSSSDMLIKFRARGTGLARSRPSSAASASEREASRRRGETIEERGEVTRGRSSSSSSASEETAVAGAFDGAASVRAGGVYGGREDAAVEGVAGADCGAGGSDTCGAGLAGCARSDSRERRRTSGAFGKARCDDAGDEAGECCRL